MHSQKQPFLSKLQGLSHSRSPHRTFSDWLEIAAITLHQLPYQSGELAKDAAFERLEQRYMEAIEPYSKNDLTVLSEMLSLTLIAHHTGYGDFLGEMAGEAELLNKQGGQFFTPYHLCRAMAKMTLGNIAAQVKEKGVITLAEPAVGAGALVIASAEEVASQGIDPCAHLQFDCTDISRDAFNMAYIQLSAMGLQAVVRHGNTLSDEYWEHRPTPQLRLFHQWHETQQRTQRLVQAVRSLFEEAAPSEDCEIAPVPEPSVTLFDMDEFAVEPLRKRRDHPQSDIVLDRQMTLFGS
ncbi:N-6 DNA methylase [Leptolyngbya sp. BC1307]|uniref:N-6 DNA methylase n=1 Tax=Leptolyngbya sp. BC1307 TaxID=2029589 RepID=UPI000EFC65C4|nr:N-6 DNA methylase [Leptolyngbya sp. BC1307]